jgi:hypothetical protein
MASRLACSVLSRWQSLIGDGVNGGGRVLSLIGLLSAGALMAPSAMEAQVGLSSRTAQVVLVAHSDARGSIETIGVPTERSGPAGTREVSVPVRLFANAGYRLTVIRNEGGRAASARMWIRTDTGEFEVLEPGSPILVARSQQHAGQRDLDVLYLIESATSQESGAPAVRYELAIIPQL